MTGITRYSRIWGKRGICRTANPGCEAEKVIELYHKHGTSEQFHSELKSDMEVERLPSGKFEVNRIVLAVAMTAYNALRVPGRKKYKRKRLGKVIRELICVAGKLVRALPKINTTY
jgi:hypothetical protein